MPAEMTTNSAADLGDIWPPGFRFHPTDEELLLYYLKRKICRQRLKLDAVSEVDVYKWNPEELPGLSALRTGDKQWFFFSPRDRKYPNGQRSNRATPHGYWKTTGKDRNISYNIRPVGIKKTLVFYRGRAPSGERTDWVMHEYTLEEAELKRCQNVQDYYALYKLYKKGGAGPRNGEDYGAPFREEEWDDDVPAVSNYIGSGNHVNQSSDIASADMHKIDAQVQFTWEDDRNDDVLAVSNYIGSDNHVNQSNDIASADMHKIDAPVQCTWEDIEEFMKQYVNDPAPEGPDNGDCECAVPQVFVEEGQSTLTDISLGKDDKIDPCDMHPPFGEQNIQGCSSFTLPAASEVQLQDVYGMAYSGVNDMDQHAFEEDFLEMDDLLGPDFTDELGEFMSQPADEFDINSQWGDNDKLNELDLYYDDGMFLRELSPINQTRTSHPQVSQLVTPYDLERINPSSSMNSVGPQQQQAIHDQNNFYATTSTESNPGVTPFTSTGDICGANFTPNATEFENGKGVEGDDKWITSVLWSFVESIPTTPASAADSALVNRAFERMSSFSRLRLKSKRTTAAAIADAATSGSTGGRMKGFFLLSLLGALFAILFVLLGMFGNLMFPSYYVKYI